MSTPEIISGLSAVADRYDVVLCDVWGVIHNGRESFAAACDALATARALSVSLRRLPLVDFGIGVSAGRVFAGNIGAEHRYEYTVIGDPVNEAARLADKAKDTPGRALCSDDALVRAGEAERAQWRPQTSEVLRGRLTPTRISAPSAGA